MTPESVLETIVPKAILDRYDIEALLKDDALYKTILLRDKQSREKKIFKYSANPNRSLRNEYELMQALAGDGIPVCRRFFEDKATGKSYLIRDYVPGKTLMEYVAEQGPMEESEAIETGVDLCKIIDRLHRHVPPVIHRDIKPENIVRTPEGRLMLIDLDIARYYSEQASRDTVVMGTPLVAPPEQFGYGQTDTRSDVYAIGVLLLFLISGSSQLDEARSGHRLSRTIRKCTSFAPNDRYRDAAALLRALGKLDRRPRVLPCRALLALLSLLLAALLGFFGLRFLSKRAVYRFVDPALERVVLQKLNKSAATRGDLEGITELIVAGPNLLPDGTSVARNGGYLLFDGAQVSGTGNIASLEDIAAMPNLTRLCLARQRIDSLEPLRGHSLQELYISGCAVRSIDVLASCPSLQKLDISENLIEDFTPLGAITSLTQLDVSISNIVDLSPLASLPSLKALHMYYCKRVQSVAPLSEIPSLRSLWLALEQESFLPELARLSQLEHLYLWDSDPLTSLRQFSSLTHLHSIFLDGSGLRSLDGLESFPELELLHLYHEPIEDVSALDKAPNLFNLRLIGASPKDWSPLLHLPKLWLLSIDEDQLPAVQQLPLNPSVEISVE